MVENRKDAEDRRIKWITTEAEGKNGGRIEL